MRQIVLDTETTGLEPKLGHRIIELAAVEMRDRRLTGNRFHRYLNPEREIDAGALQVHGITTEFLQDKPRFGDIAREFLDFIHDAELIIHNAPFDVAFLDHELGLMELSSVTQFCRSVTDTLQMAKELHPGKKNSLDALCERYQVDNSHRTLHGALLDAELLAEVYLAMTRGQESLMIELQEAAPRADQSHASSERHTLVVIPATPEELKAHAEQLESIDKESRGACLWKKMQAPFAAGD